MDNINYNGPIRADRNYVTTDWSKIKPYDFASDFAQWRKANSKQDNKVKPDFQILSVQYNNLLKKDYPEGANVPKSFYEKVYDISSDLGIRNGKVIHCDMKDLLAIMFNESKFDSKLVGMAKDIAAGAVMFASVVAIIIGILLFGSAILAKIL